MPKPKRAAPRKLDDAGVEALLDSLEAVALGSGTPEAFDQATLVQQLWQSRVRTRELITKRIISGKSRAPKLMLELLTMASGPQGVPFLRRIAASANLPSPFRLEARRRAGWPERVESQRRRAFLDSLPDAEAALAAFVRAADLGPLAEGELIEEALDYLVVLSASRALAVLEHLDAEPSPATVRFLSAALHLRQEAIPPQALTMLARWQFPGSAGAVERLARTSRWPAVRSQAEAAALSFKAAPESDSLCTELMPVSYVWATMIDGDGGQSLMLFRRWDEQVYLWATFLVTDDWGVKDVYGMTHAPAETLETITEEMEAQGVSVVEVDLAYLRGALARGITINQETEQPIPPAFELWEPWTHEAWPPPPGEAVAPVELDDTPYRGRRDLLRHSMELINHPWFDSWSFRPEQLGPAFRRVPPPASERERERSEAALYAAILEEVRDRLRAALRSQAYLLERTGDTTTRDLALAESAWLADAPQKELTKNDFLEEMVERGISQLTFGLPLDMIPADALSDMLSGKPFILPPFLPR